MTINSRPLATNRRRPCPVCGKTNGNCRTFSDSDLVLCMTLREDRNHPDYRYVRESKDNTWSTYAPRTGKDFERESWNQRKAEREERDREIERQRLEKCLTPEQKHSEYSRLFAELGLSDGHSQNLLKRGLSDAEIKHGGYVSVDKFQPLRGKYHVNLPGISKYGTCLTNRLPGFIVPVRNADGLIVAYQVRDSEAYKWAKGAKMANGEQPMGVATPAAGITQPKVIGTGEGFLKTQIAANRLGIPFVGAAGGNFTPKETQQALNKLSQGWEIKVIDYPDAGWKANPHVARTTYRRVKLIESLGYSVVIADWGQGWDKSVGDIDEITDAAIASIKLLSAAAAFADVPNLKTKAEKFADWVAKQAKRFKPPGFGAPKIEGNRFEGDRQSAWQDAINRGKAFLDSTLMGSGKSFTVPKITNPYGGKIWYVYGDHRNPTIEAIAQDFTDLFPRNSKGFYTDTKGKIKPADDYHPATITNGRCTRSELFPLLTELGHDPNDGGGSNPICQSCPMAGVCAHAKGWYRFDRRETLENATHIRCHIESMPRDWDYSKDIILIDEPSQQLTPTRKITAGWDDLLLEADKIRPTLTPELWHELDTYIQAIKPLFEPKGTNPYGISHGEIVEGLPTVSPELSTAIMSYHHDLSDLFPKAERENMGENFTRDEVVVKRSKWTPEERKQIKAGLAAFNEQESLKAHLQAQENLAKLPPNALAHLIGGNAVIRIQKQTLILTIDRRADYSFLNRAASVGFLDATISGNHLQTISGLERTIEVIHNTPTNPLGNLTVKQIKVQGIGSKQVSNTALNRLHAVLKTFPDQPIIGLKAWAKLLDLDGYWWRDSRGTNDYEGIPELLAIGLPNPNLGAVQDDHLALNGNLDGFDEHYARLVNEEILQLIGRQRANRYPDRQFVLNLVTPENCDLSWLKDYGITLEVKQGFEINPAAGNQTQFTRFQIISAIIDGNRTQTAIAAAIGKTQQAISKQLAAAGITLEKLIDQLSKFLPEMATTGPYKAFTRTGCITQELLNDMDWFFGLDIPAIAQEVFLVITRDGWLGFLKYLEVYPKPIQAKLLAVSYSLIGTIPAPT